jgi:hypothetical protein
MQIHNQPPVINSFTATPNPVTKPANFTLAVNASDPDNDLSIIYLYRESNGTPGLQPNEDQYLNGSGQSPFSLELSSTAFPHGQHLFYAEAFDIGGARAVASVPLRIVDSRVMGRHVFYNRSFFDGNNAAAGAADDGAIDTSKSALMPGGTGGFANYTAYSRGLNGVMIDIQDRQGALSAGDFAFKTGNNNTPASWAPLTTPPSITIRNGAGVGGSDRVTLIWPDNTIQKTWLQVTVRATANTGLAADDVFYFGNAVGEVGNSTTNAIVTAADESLIRLNFTTGFSTVPVTSPYDIDKNRFVQASDAALARANQTTAFSALRLIAVPAESSPLGPREVSGGSASLDSELVNTLANARRRKR